MMATDPETQTPHILVVDDDSILRSIANESLTSAGFQVTEAENGAHALEMVGHVQPDITLMDVMMPEMNGFDATASIRKTPGLEHMPILIMTALGDVESIDRAYEVGATDFITKPINWVILLHRVRYMLRTAKIMAEQKQLQMELQQAQKLEAVATLAAGVAHDFNNLLQSIQMVTELLQLSMDSQDAGYQDLDRIKYAVDKGGELTRQLLTYSRKIESEKQQINLNDQIRQVHDLLQRTIPKMVHIDLQLDDDLHRVNADPVQLEQVLMNLAINARDSMPNGGELTIKTANKVTSLPNQGHQDVASISVTDTGQGMDPDTLEHIFEPFFTTKGSGKGTGLGLAMVHGIVQSHNGEIICRSEPGMGTRFEINLPATHLATNQQKKTEENKICCLGDETILLVDDDENQLNAVTKCLENAGFTILAANNGEEALALYKQQSKKINLVLLDLIMPGMGGVKCLENLLQINPKMKTIIVSGFSPDEKTVKFLEKFAAAKLRKPFTADHLLNTTRNVLNHSQTRVE